MSGPDAVTTDVLRLRADAGAPPDDLVGLPARAARALAVAHEVGAPVGEALDGALAADEDARRSVRAVAVASAQTRVVAGGLLLAPLLLVPGLGRLIGADLIGFYRSGTGTVVLTVGLGLLVLGAAVVLALVRRVGRTPTPGARGGGVGLLVAVGAGAVAWRLAGQALAPIAALLANHLVAARAGRRPRATGLDEAADLAATALAGGVSVPEALRVAAGELPTLADRLRRLAFDLELGGALQHAATTTSRTSSGSGVLGAGTPSFRMSGSGIPGSGASGSGRASGPTSAPSGSGSSARTGRRRREPDRDDPWLRVDMVLRTATALGSPVAPTLRRLASDLRADDLARVLAAAERLPAQLTFPTALCLLPATVLLVGAPIVHAGLVATGT